MKKDKISELNRMGNITLALLLGAFTLEQIVTQAHASPPAFKKVMIVLFENTNYQDALDEPAFKKLTQEGALLTNLYAETHPSQGNYIALTAGSTYDVNTDSSVNLDVKHIGDLLEAKGKSWKIYLESYPGNCFKKSAGTYVRKHNPFISFKNIQSNSDRCSAHLVDASVLAEDIQTGTVPDYSIYIPDLNNDGHDTGVAYADKWFSQYFGPLMQNQKFIQDLLLIATFDESGFFGGNHIYGALFGEGIKAGSSNDDRYDHYSLLRTIEDAFEVGTLGQEDAQATPISGIWK
jgi:hypothetical protein